MAWDARKRCAARNWQCSIAKSGDTRSIGPASSRRANGRIWTVSCKLATLKKGVGRDEFAVVSSLASLRRHRAERFLAFSLIHTRASRRRLRKGIRRQAEGGMCVYRFKPVSADCHENRKQRRKS